MKRIKYVLIAALLICATGCKKKEDSTNYNNQISGDKETVIVNTSTDNDYTNLTELIENTRPTVVDVYSYGSNFSSAGSGVIIGKSDQSYYVVTNHHVIDSAIDFEVVVYNNNKDEKTYKSTLVGSSPKNDVAVLEIKTTDELSVCTVISDSSSVKVGTEVIAIGNPLGILGGSVTHGIISATEREMYLDEIGYMKLFQTDAAINSGNSGGALFNYDGVLIGIVNSGYSSYEGLNFAIPANTVLSCVSSIIDTYNNQGGNLGYMEGETNINATFSEANIYTDNTLSAQQSIVYLQSINTNSDLANKNIKDYQSFQAGTVNTFYSVKKVNDTEIKDVDTLNKMLQETKAGDKLTFTFVEISYVRTGGFISQTVYYLTENTITVEITLSQYIYSLNN